MVKKWEVDSAVSIDQIMKIYHDSRNCIITTAGNKFFELDLQLNATIIKWFEGSGYNTKLTKETTTEDLMDLKERILGMGFSETNKPEEISTFNKSYMLF